LARVNRSYRLIASAAVILIIIASVPTVRASVNPVGPLVADIASLPLAQGNSCQGVISAVQGGGQVEQYLDKYTGTNFQSIVVSSGECSVLVSFVPLIGTYNGLIVAAQNYNPNNPKSVQNFWEQAFLVAAEVTLIGFALDGVLYETSFNAVAELNDGLKLAKLRSLCGTGCYSDVLSSLYWFINDTMAGAMGNFLQWAARYLPTSELPPLPPMCGVPILGGLLAAFGLLSCKR